MYLHNLIRGSLYRDILKEGQDKLGVIVPWDGESKGHVVHLEGLDGRVRSGECSDENLLPRLVDPTSSDVQRSEVVQNL